MDKPEDIRGLVARAAYGAQWDEDFPKEGGIEWHMAMQVADAILPFILSAQSQAYIDAARIAEDIAQEADAGEFYIASRIEDAILQRKEEIGR